MKPDTPPATTFQLPLLPYTHRNQQLFSDHYLDTILPAHDDWRALTAEAESVMQQLQIILANFHPSTKEAQTEEDFVKPVLKALGHLFEVQASLETPGSVKAPDYIFYRDQAALAANKGKKLNERLLQGRALAVGDAKYWDRPLDVSLKHAGSDLFDNKNPSYQIFFYIQHSGLDWGILTNGRLWRLYHKDTAHKLDRFYEVDLSALLQAGEVTHFLYFYAFFRRQAFEAGPLALTDMLRASTEYARGVGDSLKTQVYDALRHLAQGFLDYTPNRLQADAPTLTAIYDNALIVLYRLLFILYAEARELLPVNESEQYRQNYSLKAIKESIKRDLDAHNLLLPGSMMLWSRLKALFTIINEGSPPLHVATFNGGLFDPARHPFLEQRDVGDAHLQQAIDKLARVDGQFVDYRDLAERHLGSIYEGLLEFHLEPLETPEDGWTLRLVNAKGERKATGSYYTPDYIVKYMVEETVGPALHTAIADASSDEEKIAAILGVKVVDPAMGSGHFPVETTEYIARFLVEQIEQPPADAKGEADLAYWKRRVAQACIYGVDLNPLAVDLAKLSLWLATVAKNRPLSFLDHHLRCGNSLIGARLSDLREGVGGAPKKSNKKAKVSIIEGEALAQTEMFDEESLRRDMTTAVDSMWLIESSPAQTVAEVKQQEQTYQALHQALMGKYSALANLASAVQVGAEIDPAYLPALARYVAEGQQGFALPQFKPWLEATDKQAERTHFFHWELEFPEVFFDRLGQSKGPAAGFDVVIGNPPYVRQEGLGNLKPYFAAAYPETYHGVADLYVYFYEQGLRLTRVGGRMAYIVTNKWMRAGYGESLRAYFAEHAAVERIIDFGHAPIFEDADVFPCILILRKPTSQEQADLSTQTVQALTFPREELGKVNLGRYIQEQSQDLPQSRFGRTPWNLGSSAVDDLLAKIRRVGVPLTDFAGVKPYRGVLTGLNEAFLIDTPTKEALLRADPHAAEIIKPYLRGQDIKRWSPEWAGLWMIVLKSSGDNTWPWSNSADEVTAEAFFQQTYPSLHEHMKPLESKLRKRQDHGRYWWELRACAYYDTFAQPKLIHTDITWRPQFALNETTMYLLNTAYMWPAADPYILAVVNSPLMWSYMWRNATHGKDEALRLIYSFVETLPIAPPSEAIRAEVEPVVKRLIEIARANHDTRQVTLDWLRARFGLDSPGAALEDLAGLDLQAFIAEVGKRLPKNVLTPGAVKDLSKGYHDQATPLRERLGEATGLERRLADLVNAAYGLTPEEIALLKETAPPRMPQF
jgi:type I restriction-modification system DNA methylase subunit